MVSDERIEQMTRQIFHHAPPAAKVFLAPVIRRALREAAAEATAAFKAQVRAQVVRQNEDGYGECRACLNTWSPDEKEWHDLVDAQPCAAEVEP